jgi:hypothetical protein
LFLFFKSLGVGDFLFPKILDLVGGFKVSSLDDGSVVAFPLSDFHHKILEGLALSSRVFGLHFFIGSVIFLWLEYRISSLV